tara:strand:+ start:94 stop:822 length:729 start_codon:yes stop_codon:yes gene_type:complete
MNDKVTAIILARGGSKGIPDKNILNFVGKPLVAWSVIQAKLTKEIDEVYISSDSDKILDIAEKYGAKKIKRPDSISGDHAKSEEAILHALEVIGGNHKCIIMLEPTAPLRKPDDLSNAVNLFIENDWDSAFSSAELQDFLIWKRDENDKLVGVNYNYKIQEPRQLRDMEYVENGAIYIFKPEIMINELNRFGGDIGMIPNQFWQSFEIDEKDDWEFVELIFKNYLLSEYNKRIAGNKEYEGK